MVDDWLELLRKRFRADPSACVAVHCVAGLGRAPVLVALALMELGLKYEDAVELIRQYVSLLNQRLKLQPGLPYWGRGSVGRPGTGRSGRPKDVVG